MFYTTPGHDGAIAVTCDRCLQSVGCPDPYAAATAKLTRTNGPSRSGKASGQQAQTPV